MDGWVGGLPILLHVHSLTQRGLSRNKIPHSPQLNHNFTPSKSKPTCRSASVQRKRISVYTAKSVAL